MEKNRNTILGFYAVLSLVVILSSVPDFKIQNVGYTLIMIELVIAYIARARWPRGESFEENHSTYIIRTIWMYSFLFTIGAVAASYLVWVNGDKSAIEQITDMMVNGSPPSEDETNAAMMKYYEDNKILMMNTTRLWLCPSQLYLVWRILQGGGRAFKSYRLANPKRWF